MNKPVLYLNKVHKDAVMPTKKVTTDACWDVYTVQDEEIPPKHVKALHTGWRLAIPNGYEVVVRPRSGLSLQYPSYLSNSPGTIDEDYRDELKVIFANNTESIVKIDKFTKIAQIKLQKVCDHYLTEINDKEYDRIKKESDRGGGFGSSGNHAF